MVGFAVLWLSARRWKKKKKKKRCVLWRIAFSLSSTIIRSVRGGTAPSPFVAAADGENVAEYVLIFFLLRSDWTVIWIYLFNSLRFCSCCWKLFFGGSLSFRNNAVRSPQESKLLFFGSISMGGFAFLFILMKFERNLRMGETIHPILMFVDLFLVGIWFFGIGIWIFLVNGFPILSLIML